MNTKFNVKQWAIASLAVFVISTIFAYVPTKLEIAPWFLAQGQAAQGDEMTKRILIYLSRLIGAGLFTFIFTKTSEGKPGIGHGLRYGLGISLLIYVPGMISAIANTDWPTSTLLLRTVVGIIESVICGAAVAQLYKPDKPAAA
ncbi:MAG: hypothetical protein HW412_708 [Bacteroidetes bacterium]|nr:hypothetical protein [Bacteroidota bacterium]